MAPPVEIPPAGTVERWAWDYVTTTDLAHKRRPPPLPRIWEASPPARRVDHPGRPPELVVVAQAPKSPGPDALAAPEKRAALMHTFLHHELQAAELMCWALLAFPESPLEFRRGLLGIADDEVRHMDYYEGHMATLGHRYGDFPVRDWFWERIPASATPAHYVASMGIGLEGGNLDHMARFADRFRAVGDVAGAEIEERVSREEVAHVRFAMHWFARWTGVDDALPPADRKRAVSFTAWAEHLPPPLSPMLMRGSPLNTRHRAASGFSETFMDELTRWAAPGS